MPSNEQDERRQVLITGATDGIGLELARLCAARGDRLVLVGRRPLAKLDPGIFTPDNYCRADLRATDAAQQVADFVGSRHIDRLDLLIHNAAAGWVGAFREQTAACILDLLAVNLVLPIRLTGLLAQPLQRCNGCVVIVSSVAAWMPSGRYVVYAAAKAGLEAFARALHSEWRGRADVIVSRLGAVRTGLHAKSGWEVDDRVAACWPSARQAALAIGAMIARRRSATLGLGNRIAVGWARRFPEALARLRGQHRQGNRSVAGRWLVTGAAGGIGRALSEALIRRGAFVVGVDNDSAGLAATARQWAHDRKVFESLHLDLARAAEWTDLGQSIANQAPLSGVVFCAGISATGRFECVAPKEQLAVLDVNLTSAILHTRELLKADKLAPGATLVFVSSLSHFVGYPGAAVYAATKSALAAFASGLSFELGRRDINVLTVFPGPTRTAHARRYSPAGASEHKRMPPDVVAGQIVKAIESGQSALIPGWRNRLAAAFGRWLPAWTDAVMRRALFRPLCQSLDCNNTTS